MTDWTDLHQLTTNMVYESFNKKLIEIMDKHAPLKTHMVTNKNILREEWVSCSLIKCSKKCYKFYKDAIGKQKDVPKSQKYIQYRNILNKLKKIEKRNYYVNKITVVKGDTKKPWHILNKITNKVHKKNAAIDVLKCNGTNVTDGKMICNILNEYFCTVGTEIASMQSNIGNPMSYLRKKVQQSLC